MLASAPVLCAELDRARLNTDGGGDESSEDGDITVKTLSRLAVATAATLALTLAPIGMASAHDHGSPTRDRTSTTISMTDNQRGLVLAARSTYLTNASAITKAYRTTVAGIRAGIVDATEPSALALAIAKDALAVTAASGGDTTAARAAFEAAKATYTAARTAARAAALPKFVDAKTTARAGLEAQRVAYVASVTSAFAPAAVPASLLKPPGYGKYGQFGKKGKRGDQGNQNRQG